MTGVDSLSSSADGNDQQSLDEQTDQTGREDQSPAGEPIPIGGTDQSTNDCVGDIGYGCDWFGSPKTANGYLDETGMWVDLSYYTPDPYVSAVVDQIVAETADASAAGQQVAQA